MVYYNTFNGLKSGIGELSLSNPDINVGATLNAGVDLKIISGFYIL
jgi:hypothetical protein